MPDPHPNEPRLDGPFVTPDEMGLSRQGRWLKRLLESRGLDVSPGAPAVSWFTDVVHHSLIVDQPDRPKPS